MVLGPARPLPDFSWVALWRWLVQLLAAPIQGKFAPQDFLVVLRLLVFVCWCLVLD